MTMEFYLMQSIEFSLFPHPSDSYSRKLDKEVSLSEMPYGYSFPPPPADTADFDQRRLESNKQYSLHQGRAR